METRRAEKHLQNNDASAVSHGVLLIAWRSYSDNNDMDRCLIMVVWWTRQVKAVTNEAQRPDEVRLLWQSGTGTQVLGGSESLSTVLKS
jgi:hypothetical protein